MQHHNLETIKELLNLSLGVTLYSGCLPTIHLFRAFSWDSFPSLPSILKSPMRTKFENRYSAQNIADTI